MLKLLGTRRRRRLVRRVIEPIVRFMEVEASGGILLLACVAVAMGWANSPWSGSYFSLLEASVGPGFLRLSVQQWINDLLMAVFFLVVGLEIKREILCGELSSVRHAALPMAAAIGGMAVPAALYAAVNLGGEGARGWGIPMATDIAFSLGVLAFVGSRAPAALKVFLTALAIVDDLGAVLVIAIAYTGGVSAIHLLLAAAALCALLGAQAMGVRALWVYCMLGLALWAALVGSGLHATMAGVLTAIAVPLSGRTEPADEDDADEESPEADAETQESPLERLEGMLHPWLTYLIVPLFALANAGVRMSGDPWASLLHPVSLGIVLGLLVGKPLGIVGASWAAVRAGAAALPRGVGWRHMAGVGALGGIGFTMSLFVATLAFREAHLLEVAKIGILAGSLASGLMGFALLRRGADTAEEPDAAGSSEGIDLPAD